MWAKVASMGDGRVARESVDDAKVTVEGDARDGIAREDGEARRPPTRDAGRGARGGMKRSVGARGGNGRDGTAWIFTGERGEKSGNEERIRRERDAATDLDGLIERVERADATEVGRVLRESIFKPGPPAYTSIIKACGKIGQWEKALEVYRLMTTLHGAKPNTITCSALINVLGKSKQCDKAFEIYEEMKQRKIPANIFTYSALLSACAKTRQYQRGMDVFNDLVENHQEIEIDRITYSAAMNCCVQGRRADKAIEIFNQMTAAGIKGNTVTYNAVLNACERSGDGTHAVEMFERMRAEKVAVDRTTFHAVIGALDRARDLPRAIEYYRMMKNCSVRPDAATVSNMLLACANAKDPNAAIKIYKEAQTKYDLHCTPGMFNALVSALHKGKRYDLVYEQLYDSMSQSALSVSTYVHLMMACERFGNFDKSLELFQEFKKHSPSSVDPFVWTRAFFACGRFAVDDPVWKNGSIPGYSSPTLERARSTLRGLWTEYKLKLIQLKGSTAEKSDGNEEAEASVGASKTNVHENGAKDETSELTIHFGDIHFGADPVQTVPSTPADASEHYAQLMSAYRSAAAAAARCSDPDTVLDILIFCEANFMPRDSVLLGAYVAALALNGDRMGANAKFVEMLALGLQPGVAVYAALARAAARAGDANTALALAEDVSPLVGSTAGDADVIEAVVAACEAGGDWNRGVNLFALWAKNGVEGASEELERAVAASSGRDPGPTRRQNYARAHRVQPAPKLTTLTAKVEPFVPRQSRSSDDRSRTTSVSDGDIDSQPLSTSSVGDQHA